MFTGSSRALVRARVPLLALAAALLFVPAARADTVRLAGTDAVGTNVSSAEPGHAEVYKTSATATGTVSSLSLNLDGASTATGLELGLYADSGGQPTTLLTSGRIDGPVAGWNTITVPGVRIESGRTYWIGLLNPVDATGMLRWTDRAGGESGGGEQTGAGSFYETLPDTWETGALWSDGPLSAYASGTTDAPAGPALEVAPSAVSFWATRGAGSPAPKTLSVTNAGSGSLSYTVSDNASWLSVSPASGSAPGTVTATVNTSGLAAGSYQATITVTASGAGGSPRAVPVTLTVNPAPASSGLVGAWSFNETSGANANDSSGKRNVGNIMGATHTSGMYGGGLSFDGVDDWVTIADSTSLDLKSALTLEAWVRPETLGSVWRTILIKEQSDQLAYALYANTDAGRPSGNVFTDADHGLAGTSALPTGEWSHVATTWDGTTLKLYVNGNEVAGQPLSGNAVTSSGALRIGGNAIWGEWFNGKIDEVRVYNRALSPAELAADRDTPIGASSGSELSPLEKLKAALLRLLARWREHWGHWTWHGKSGWFKG